MAEHRSIVPLRTSKGTLRVTLPRPRPASRARRRLTSNPLGELTESFEDRWKKFRRRLRAGIPTRRGRIDEAVHDLRVAARRLLSALAVLEPFSGGKALKRLSRRVDAILEQLGPLRDLGVQIERLRTLEADAPVPGIRRLMKRLGQRHGRQAERLRRRLCREKVGRLKDDVRRVLKRTSRAIASLKAPKIRRAALEVGQEALARLHEERLAVNPMELETIHRMRIALKKFRYLMEALHPLVPGAGEKDLDALHKLQTTMGDLHDLEVVTSTLSRHVEKLAPKSAAAFAPLLATLEQKHSSMLSSFLEGVDPILDPWRRFFPEVTAGSRTR